jgi:glutamine amidotransferase
VKVTIFDYGAGNLHSLCKAIALAGVDPVVETDPVRAAATEVLILPGVGAFAPAADRLAAGRERLRAAIADGLPVLGICLGLQLLFESSDEGPGQGIGAMAGRVSRIDAARLPQIGWNDLEDVADPLVLEAGLTEGYYANSYVARPDDWSVVSAWSRYDRDRFPAVVRWKRTLGVQFHPEKSSAPGVRLIRGFLAASRR